MQIGGEREMDKGNYYIYICLRRLRRRWSCADKINNIIVEDFNLKIYLIIGYYQYDCLSE